MNNVTLIISENQKKEVKVTDKEWKDFQDHKIEFFGDHIKNEYFLGNFHHGSKTYIKKVREL